MGKPFMRIGLLSSSTRAGLNPTVNEGILQQVREQAEVAIQEADLVLFLLDGQEGLNPLDLEVAGYLRKVAKPVFYVVNKVDGERQEAKRY